MRALIVDDSSFIREYIRQQMEYLGWSCVEAPNGSEALGVLRRDDGFGVMLVDVNMPVMDGMECVRLLREAQLAPEMKVMPSAGSKTWGLERIRTAGTLRETAGSSDR